MLILGVQLLHGVSTICGAALLTAAVAQSAADKACASLALVATQGQRPDARTKFQLKSKGGTVR